MIEFPHVAVNLVRKRSLEEWGDMEKKSGIQLMKGETAVGLKNTLLMHDDRGRWAFATSEGEALTVRNALSCKDGESWLFHALEKEFLIDYIPIYANIMALGGWELVSHGAPKMIGDYPVIGRVGPTGTFDIRNSQMVVKMDGTIKIGYLDQTIERPTDLIFSQSFTGAQFHRLLENLADLMGLVDIPFKMVSDSQEGGTKFLLKEWNVDNDGPVANW
ncbi:MAG: hypothetical protein ACRCZE_00625 [Candidatus Altimarinota bacterium]